MTVSMRLTVPGLNAWARVGTASIAIPNLRATALTLDGRRSAVIDAKKDLGLEAVPLPGTSDGSNS
jgi:hypothetical protein